MADEDSVTAPDPQEEEDNPQNDLNLGSSSDSDSDSDSDSSSDEEGGGGGGGGAGDGDGGANDDILTYTRPGDEPPESENTPEVNIPRFTELLNSRRMRRRQEEEDRSYMFYEDLFDFPEDREKWREEDLKELWADAPLESTKPGWDPYWADEEDWEIVRDEIREGRDPPIAPFYIPYRKPYPALPDNHYDISNPKAVVEELDRIEEFMRWVSYIFPDGSSYEGTVWDDLAHGKGVYEAENGLVRYEGEWLQNNPEGHGVVEVEIPDIEPVPGSKLEAKMRAEGRIIARDFMSPEDREWLEKDIEDSVRLAGGNYEIPFYENEEWIRQFGEKPEKGRYRYAGQWKHGRMHGCGVYEVNERMLYGRFYFGELLEDSHGCDDKASALHSGIAEVAAAKARMFVNKPDGMVREERGPYGDPQHPYFYEEEDAWMAPGFINQFYEVPEYWKRYADEVDKEREMWLNSFYKAPLRLPMPAELEYWWEKDETPEFILINKEHDPDVDDPSNPEPEDPLIVHTPTGRIINYIEDEEQGIRLFWQPQLEDGEDVDPNKAAFLPLGYDEFYGKEEIVKKETFLKRVVVEAENACKPVFEKMDKWMEAKKKDSEMKMKLIEKELDLIEAELCLEEAIEDMDEELKEREEEEQKKVEMGVVEEEKETPEAAIRVPAEKTVKEAEVEEDDEEEEDEEEAAPSSFGTVSDGTKNGPRRSTPPFSTSSLGFASCSLISAVSSRLQQSFMSVRQNSLKPTPSSGLVPRAVEVVRYPQTLCTNGRLTAVRQEIQQRKTSKVVSSSQLHSLSRILSPRSAQAKAKTTNLYEPRGGWLHEGPVGVGNLSSILSLHKQVPYMENGI